MSHVQESGCFKHLFSLKKQESIRNSWLNDRLHHILKEAMIKADIPMWIVISKEYNEDPVVASLNPCENDSSRRLSIYAFVLDDEHEGVERYFIGSPHPALKGLYTFIWNRNEESQWERLKKLVEEKQPAKIGINQSKQIAVADGLTNSLYEMLCSVLGTKWISRLVSAEYVAIHWFLKRSKKEMEFYPILAELTRNIAKIALSNEVITPKVTTTTQVVEWIRQKVLDLGMKTSFYPTVDIQRKDGEVDRLDDTIILPGDIVHLDFGIDYGGLCTDTQQLAYVLHSGELKPPKGLEDALQQALIFEDIVMAKMKDGKSGNEVFVESMAEAKQKSINGMLYSHPIGSHCHEAGPIIGLYDQQKEIPFKGDLQIINDSAYALEFNIKMYIPEWGHETYIYLEQPIGIYRDGTKYLVDRQENFYLID